MRSPSRSLGKSFLVYDLDRLIVKAVAPPRLTRGDGVEPISALAALGERTFCACGSDVLEYRRAKLHRVLLDGAKHEFGSVQSLLVFGKSLVVLTSGPAGATHGRLVMLDIRDRIEGSGIQRSIELGKTSRKDRFPAVDRFSPTCFMHPDTYLNKVVVGSAEGVMDMVNLRSGEVVHRFQKFSAVPDGVGITCVEQSTAVDVVAIGFSDGHIVLHNLRLDASLMHFVHKGGAVSSISFRSDRGGPSAPVPFAMMTSASSTGELAVWDLDERRLASVVRDAHDGPISRASFLPNEPLLVTSGADNAIKVFIFDQDDGQARLLKLRQGHKAPPTCIRYYGGDTLSTLASGADASCCQILSAGRDRALRVFHTARDQLNRELSQGPLLKRSRVLDVKVEQLKLPPIVDFAATEARHRDWCNIISAHSGEGAAFTWSLENRVIGQNVLRPDGVGSDLTLKKLHADKVSLRAGKFPAVRCVGISACGNFGIVGTADGTIFKYNMQSGRPRGSFPSAADAKLSKEQKKAMRAKRRKLNPSSVQLLTNMDATDLANEDPIAAVQSHPSKHEGAVNGVGVDSLNTVLFSAGYDGTVRFWNFVEHKLESVVDLGSPVSKLVANRDAGIFAVALDDLRVVVFDATSRRAIRTFKGHTAAVTDMAISTDARWLATASNDTSLRIWDLPTARCIDWLEFPTPVTGLTFSPTGEFLATSFSDSVGITLWANRCHFGDARPDAIALRPIRLQAPSAAVPEDEERAFLHLDGGDELSEDDTGDEAQDRVEPASCDGQVCFAGSEPSKWYTLAHLELIKERNKPQEAPQKPEKAPFFLSTTQAVNPSFTATSGAAEAGTPAETEDAPPELAGAGDWSDDDDEEEEEEVTAPQSEAINEGMGMGSRILKSGAGLARPRSKLFQLLEHAHAEAQAARAQNEAGSSNYYYGAVVAHLATLSPSAVDFEIRNMTLGTIEDEDGAHLLSVALDWVLAELQARTNFELCQAILSRVLALHSELLVARPELQARLAPLQKAQDAAWKGLRGLFQHSLCLLSFFAHQQ